MGSKAYLMLRSFSGQWRACWNLFDAIPPGLLEIAYGFILATARLYVLLVIFSSWNLESFVRYECLDMFRIVESFT